MHEIDTAAEVHLYFTGRNFRDFRDFFPFSRKFLPSKIVKRKIAKVFPPKIKIFHKMRKFFQQ